MVFRFSVFSEFDVDSFMKMQVLLFASILGVLVGRGLGRFLGSSKAAFPSSFLPHLRSGSAR